jgi:anti-sigma B factor antagonist
MGTSVMVVEFDVLTTPGRVVVTGELDMDVCVSLREALTEAAREDGSAVTVDLSGVSFIDSSGLNELLQFTNRGHRLTLVGVTPPVRRTIELVGLEQVFSVEP